MSKSVREIINILKAQQEQNGTTVARHMEEQASSDILDTDIQRLLDLVPDDLRGRGKPSA